MILSIHEVVTPKSGIIYLVFIISMSLLVTMPKCQEIHEIQPALRTMRDIEENSILGELKQTKSYFNECEVFCLQPDIRLCQCSKEELNKYISSDMLHSSKDQKPNTNATLPHIYQSVKEKKTCGEYSVIIRKLNVAMQRIILPQDKEFYFEPTLDFQVESPINHSISNLFLWGDWIALYSKNPYTHYDNFIPGCIWQIPHGQISFYSTIVVPECRDQIINLIKFAMVKMHICVWSYERYWQDRHSGPCLCCELNFNDCSECYKCFSNNKIESEDKLSECLLNDKKNSGDENLSCYRCLNIKNPTYNCQSYENFLAKMIQDYQIHNKYQVLTNSQNNLIDI